MMKTLPFLGGKQRLFYSTSGSFFCKESSKYELPSHIDTSKHQRFLAKGCGQELLSLFFGSSCFIHLRSSTLFSLRCSFFCMVTVAFAAAHHRFAKGVMGLDSRKKHQHNFSEIFLISNKAPVYFAKKKIELTALA